MQRKLVEIYELTPTNRRKSFYGKAKVHKYDNGDRVLYSYDTPIMTINSRGEIVSHYTGWTTTTGTHINSFCGRNKKEFLTLPYADF